MDKLHHATKWHFTPSTFLTKSVSPHFDGAVQLYRIPNQNLKDMENLKSGPRKQILTQNIFRPSWTLSIEQIWNLKTENDMIITDYYLLIK